MKHCLCRGDPAHGGNELCRFSASGDCLDVSAEVLLETARAYAHRRLRWDPDRAEEAADEAVRRVFQSLADKRFDESRPLVPWLVKTIFYVIQEAVRDSRRYDTLDDRNGGDPNSDYDPMLAAHSPAFDQALCEWEMTRLCQRARLNPLETRVVILRYCQDLPVAEIALVLAQPAPRVSRALHRGHAKLRPILPL